MKSLCSLPSAGANVTIFARRPGPLDDARKEIKAAASTAEQEISAVVVDLADASEVARAFKTQPRIADILYCVAGGNHAENGFLVDIEASDLDTCMKNNYHTSAYAAQTMLKIWTEDDKAGAMSSPESRLRQMIFINSAGAFLGLPGSIAYTPAKCAVRCLADTLRTEVLRYSCPKSTYTIHCAFPADFISPGFILEQETKTQLTKRMQGLATKSSIAELESRFPSSEEIASLIIEAVGKGDFIICPGSIASSMLFTNMIGPSPKRGLGIVDSLSSILVGWTSRVEIQ
ncbi:MAG: hypothetical protein Q9224_000632 [Gallowayella concinna]